MKKPGKAKGNRNPSSMWGTGGTDIDSTTWNPSNDFMPAWIPLDQLSSQLVFDPEISAGQSQRYLPLYINNDGVADSTDVFILELDASDPSVGFSQEMYVLQEGWDQTARDIIPFGFVGVFGPYFGSAFPSESDLARMFLADGNSRPLNTPKLITGGKFKEATILIEDAQSTTLPVRLDGSNNVYFVSDIAGNPGTDAVYAGAGNDLVVGGNSVREGINNTESQSFQIEELLADHLFGEEGNDTLRGGLSNDLLNGGSGNDLLFGEAGEDILYGMMGDDILWGDYEDNYKDGNNLNGDGTDSIRERDMLVGGSGNDALFGGAGADLLYGGDGVDYLSVGKKGTNTAAHPQFLEGGSGADRFDFYTDPWLPADEIRDFTERETSSISMSFLKDFNAGEGDKVGIYVGAGYSSDFSNSELLINAAINVNQFYLGEKAATERHRFIYKRFDNSTLVEGGKLYFDRDGTGTSPQVLLAILENSPTLAHSDIVTFDDSNRLPPPSEVPPSPSGAPSPPGQPPEQTTPPPSNPSTVNPSTTTPPTASPDGLTNLPPSKRIIGSGRNDKLAGTSGDDRLSGRRGNDALRGGAGNDWLEGGLGNDKLIGGKGQDTFALGKGLGVDQIVDFEDKQDRIELLPRIKFRSLTITSQGRNTLISLGRDQLAVLKGVSSNQITAADFTSTQFLPS